MCFSIAIQRIPGNCRGAAAVYNNHGTTCTFASIHASQYNTYVLWRYTVFQENLNLLLMRIANHLRQFMFCNFGSVMCLKKAARNVSRFSVQKNINIKEVKWESKDVYPCFKVIWMKRHQWQRHKKVVQKNPLNGCLIK